MTCPQCGAPLDNGVTSCKYCGEPLSQQTPMQGMPVQGMPIQGMPMPGMQPQVIYVQQPMYPNGINPAWPIKSKVAAAILAILFGTFGVHKFYLGQSGSGILYLLFCWTGIPSVVGFIEGIVYLCSNEENWQKSNHVRTK